MALGPPPSPLGNFVLGQGGQEARGRPALGIGPGGKLLPQLPHGRQAKLGEHQFQAGTIIEAGHDAPAMPGRSPWPGSVALVTLTAGMTPAAGANRARR